MTQVFKHSRYWTPEEDALLLSFGVNTVAGWIKIAKESLPSRTGAACHVRSCMLHQKAKGIEPAPRIRPSKGEYLARVQRVKDEERALAEAETARSQYHPTITGHFFGDPLPGRSALDKRNAGVGA